MALVPRWIRDLAGAWVFYSVLPGWPAPEPRFERIARFAPWIGLVIGTLQAALWCTLQALGWPPLAQVSAVLVLAVWVTGGLHLDGVMDAADGLAAGQERCLEAMDDSRVGASGVQALMVVVLLQGASLLALATTLPELTPGLLVASGFWGRCSPLSAMLRFPYLRAEGTAAFHRENLRGRGELLPAFGAVLLGLVVMIPVAALRPLLVTLPCGVLASWWVAAWFGRRLGGHTGDTYGACVVWTETFMLALLAILLPPLISAAG